MSSKKETKEMLKKLFLHHLICSLGKRPEKAVKIDLYHALAYTIRDLMMRDWIATRDEYEEKKPRIVHYISLEFLIGRSLGNAMVNLGVEQEAAEAMSELGFNIDEIRDEEVDAGLGNGGLGRLAACFLDSMATLELPAFGYGIRYDYGIFKQIIQNGYQVEEPDNWLSRGNPWEIRRPELACVVQFGGHVEKIRDDANPDRRRWVDTQDVKAMPYDTPIPGYRNHTVNTLRLWSAESLYGFNLTKFNQGDYISANLESSLDQNITRVLYPNDNNYEGKELRLKQQYFLVSASLQDIFSRFDKSGDDLKRLKDVIVVQLNDTHPALAIPEMMRLLVDIRNYSWDKAWKVTTSVFNYTNHTLMSEALERWPVSLFEKLLPRHLEIIYQINFLFLRQVATRYINDNSMLSRMSLIQEQPEKMVRMAYMCVVTSKHVNGVAALHTELLQNGLFRDFNEFFPGKFVNVTNGITPRRWLKKANPGLSHLIDGKIGDEWPKDLDRLEKLVKFENDKKFLEELAKVKRANKLVLAKYIAEHNGIEINPDSIFDVQVKRLHEYKRQLLLALYIIIFYNRLLNDPSYDPVPRAFIFAAKAAPGYYMAKLIIRLIHGIAGVVNGNPRTRGKLTVAFLPDYRVSLAEKIMPAAELSEQISLAGTEASGTGNMKFMMNGALTLGTYDGANVEINQEVGDDNMFLFGLRTEDVARLRPSYNSRDVYRADPEIRLALDMIRRNAFSVLQPGLFDPILRALLDYNDYYMLLADLRSYCDAQDRVDATYRDAQKWNAMSLVNIARSGRFSSDRAVLEYAQEIWHVEPVKFEG